MRPRILKLWDWREFIVSVRYQPYQREILLYDKELFCLLPVDNIQDGIYFNRSFISCTISLSFSLSSSDVHKTTQLNPNWEYAALIPNSVLFHLFFTLSPFQLPTNQSSALILFCSIHQFLSFQRGI